MFLSRSGVAVPLDIEVDMSELFWANSDEATVEEFARMAQNLFDFIVSHGGTPSRWQRLYFVTDVYHVYAIAMNFLRSSFMPSLQYLETMFLGPAELDEEDEETYSDATASSPKLLFHSVPPQLRTVKLTRTPNPYLFGHPLHPQLVGLTRLELRFAESPPELGNFRQMLLASSATLAVLCLDSGTTIGPYSGSRLSPEDNPLLRIHFPKLQALSMTYLLCPAWELNVLQLLDAPNLTTLQIRSLYPEEYDDHYLELLNILTQDSGGNSRPYFPALVHLSFGVVSQDAKDLRKLLVAYPNINTLSIPWALKLTPLLKKPFLVPELKVLRIHTEAMPDLKKLVMTRYKARIPLQQVETDNRLIKRDGDYLRKYVATVTTNYNHEQRLWADPMNW